MHLLYMTCALTVFTGQQERHTACKNFCFKTGI